MLLFLLFAACGGDAKPARDGSAADDEAAVEDDAEPKTEHERLLAFAKDKREQCATLIEGIDKQSSGGDDIVKFTDDARFAEVAKNRRAVAKRVTAIEVSVPQLLERRQAYVSVLEAMGSALDEAAAAKDDKSKRTAIDRYKKLQNDRQPALDAITDWCNAPVESSDLEHGA